MDWSTLGRRLRAFPLKTLVAVMGLCFILLEEFPFSHFPMYSSFSNYTYYVYVADAKGDPIALESITSVRTSKLKKIYQSGIDELEESVKESGDRWVGMRSLDLEARRPAGEAALAWLDENCKENARDDLAARAPLTLHQVGLRIVDGEIVSTDEAVATR